MQMKRRSRFTAVFPPFLLRISSRRSSRGPHPSPLPTGEGASLACSHSPVRYTVLAPSPVGRGLG